MAPVGTAWLLSLASGAVSDQHRQHGQAGPLQLTGRHDQGPMTLRPITGAARLTCRGSVGCSGVMAGASVGAENGGHKGRYVRASAYPEIGCGPGR